MASGSFRTGTLRRRTEPRGNGVCGGNGITVTSADSVRSSQRTSVVGAGNDDRRSSERLLHGGGSNLEDTATRSPRFARPRVAASLRPSASQRSLRWSLLCALRSLGAASEIELRSELHKPRRQHQQRLQPRAVRHERLVVTEHGARVEQVVEIEADVRARLPEAQDLRNA